MNRELESKPGELRLPAWKNSLTVGGSIVALLTLLFMVAFLVVDLASPGRSPYIGLFTFLIFPCILLLSIGAVFLGLILAVRRLKKRLGSNYVLHLYPRLDLTDPRHRRFLGILAAAIALAVPMIGVLSYEGYHYTDSNVFCGAVCHTVMQPQYTAYQESAHARVKCAECHIGPGASWYVKSKLSGVHQVFAVALDSFPRPIPPAIQELRPATQTCQQCHWPAKFYGDQLVTIHHFASDESNTSSQIRMLLKTGGSDPTTGPPSGIHWHMTLGFSIDYVATDKYLQEIPWVQITEHETGRKMVYRSDGKRESDPAPTGIRRTVDCMDCHNRPTHVFKSPDRAVNAALNVTRVLQTLPYAKREAVKALEKEYESRTVAMEGIASSLLDFYNREYPQIALERKGEIERLITAVQKIYSSNFFPEMKVNWRTYPDNIGHKIFPGCFRCHDGKHVADDGTTIRSECNICHEFLETAGPMQGKNGAHRIGGFTHPFELDFVHARLRCHQCHTGGSAPRTSCADCHHDIDAFRSGNFAPLKGIKLPAEPMAGTVDCKDCHDTSTPHTLQAVNAKCMDCHSDEEDKFQGMLASWAKETDLLIQNALKTTDPKILEIINQIRKIGPAHNFEATKSILSSIDNAEIVEVPSDLKGN